MAEMVPIKVIAVFGVRNDKNRGLLVETLDAPGMDVFFFKHHDQPLSRHCEQVQNIVKSANVLRSKRILINLAKFLHEYFRTMDNTVLFKTTKLNSVNQQIEKVHQMRLNKELGAIKRKNTIADNKQANIAEANLKLLTKLEADENKFQEERIRRINELMAARLIHQSPSGRRQGSDVPLPPSDDHEM